MAVNMLVTLLKDNRGNSDLFKASRELCSVLSIVLLDAEAILKEVCMCASRTAYLVHIYL